MSFYAKAAAIITAILAAVAGVTGVFMKLHTVGTEPSSAEESSFYEVFESESFEPESAVSEPAGVRTQTTVPEKQATTVQTQESPVEPDARCDEPAEPHCEPQEEAVEYQQPEQSCGGEIGIMYVTGYSAEEGFEEGEQTASGAPVGPGVCAMNAGQMCDLGISYGDYIRVEGLGTFCVLDCGCDWGVVDIWCYTNAEAYRITDSYMVYYA